MIFLSVRHTSTRPASQDNWIKDINVSAGWSFLKKYVLLEAVAYKQLKSLRWKVQIFTNVKRCQKCWFNGQTSEKEDLRKAAMPRQRGGGGYVVELKSFCFEIKRYLPRTPGSSFMLLNTGEMYIPHWKFALKFYLYIFIIYFYDCLTWSVMWNVIVSTTCLFPLLLDLLYNLG